LKRRQEEVGERLACLMAGYQTDGFVTTEPHLLNLTISHGGIFHFRIKVVGQTAHAGWAHKGVNAIGKMAPIYHALIDLDRRRGSEIRFPLYEKGSGRSCHLNVGVLRAGDWPSTVAGFAVLEGRMGFVPGETREQAWSLLEETIRSACQGDPWFEIHPPLLEPFGWRADPWYQEPGHAYVQSFVGSMKAVLGREPQIQGRSSGNDARFTQYFGKAGVAFGPVAGNIHGSDEYLELESLRQTTRVLAVHLMDWCGIE
jgi:acetylornithine deacetylase